MDIYPPDMTTDIGKVRVLTIDNKLRKNPRALSDPGEYLLTDVQVQALIDLNPLGLKFAAADLMDVIASNEAYVAKVIKTEDLQTNGATTANAIRQHAQNLRAMANKELERQDEAAFDIVDYQTQRNIFDQRDIYRAWGTQWL